MKSAKNLEESIIPLWQPVGYSTHIIAAKVAEKLNVKTSHTGTLDPLAQGVIIVLLGETRLQKYELAKWEKEYEFEAVFGLSTDTFDPMGILVDSEFATATFSESDLSPILQGFVGDYTQQAPAYSAIQVQGKPMHVHAREGGLAHVSVPTRHGSINSLELLSLEKQSLDQLLSQWMHIIQTVKGDFRQEQVLAQWERLLHSKNDQTLVVAKLRVNMTKGLYVRSLVVDIAKRLNTFALCHNIVRTKNGDFTRENSLTLNGFFGEEFLSKYTFSPCPNK